MLSPWTWLAVGLLGAAAIPAARLAGRASLRRMFPLIATTLGLTIVTWLLVVVTLAVWRPAALPPLAALVVVAAAAAYWYSRPSFGCSRRLPPGSLSLFRSIDAIVDRGFYRREAARHGPIFKMAQFHQPVVCVVGLDRGHRLIREHEDALGPSLQRITEEVPGGFLRYMDREAHAVHGPLFRQALSAHVVADAGPSIRAAVRQALAGPRETAGPRRIDLTPVLERVTDAAFLRTLFGIEPDSPVFDHFLRASRPLARLGLSERLDPPARASLAELKRIASSRLDLTESAAAGGAARSAITELRRLDAQMPDETAIENLIFIWKVSASNAVGLLRWVIAHLGENPVWLERLKAEDARGNDDARRALTDRLISETLRLTQSEYLYRRVRRDVTFDGFCLPKDWLVRVCVAESHRDAGTFADPDRFDPDRFLDRDYPRTAYSPFGTGRHACNGVPLAMGIAHAFLEELTRSFDWTVEGQGRLERDFRHWSHWRPAHTMRLVLKAQARAGWTEANAH